MYKLLFRPFLFLLDPETAHHFAMSALKFLLALPGMKFLFRKIYCRSGPEFQQKVFGITFKNPVGLAAGFDKDAKYFEVLKYLGFGFIEVGTVTPKPQPGNPRPRLFRLKKDRALLNRMGFNNEGVEKMAERLKQREKDLVIGANIGKNKTTPNDRAVEDYAYCFERLFEYVDYFVVNVSSPNTPELRKLQESDALMTILERLQALNQKKSDPKPILLKIAPDLTETQVDGIVKVVQQTHLAGLIVCNTTIERKDLQTSTKKLGDGGISGQPLKERSTQLVQYIHKETDGQLPMIGVGGVDTPQAGQEKFKAGASLVQLYTGFVYEGPHLIKQINQLLRKSE